MPTRFRRSFNILPGVKVNMSKGGISFTVGTKGYHLNFSRRGVQQTVGLPGSGLSNSSYIMKSESDAKPEKPTRKKRTTPTKADKEEIDETLDAAHENM